MPAAIRARRTLDDQISRFIETFTIDNERDRQEILALREAEHEAAQRAVSSSIGPLCAARRRSVSGRVRCTVGRPPP